MKRRALLKATAASLTALACPAIAHGQENVLRFVPQGNLNHPDPLVTLAPTARNSGHMIWDSLYGQTIRGESRPQMVAGHEVSDDGRTWRFTLREGLTFHDGEPVRAADCVASFRRWSARRSIGQKLQAEMDHIRVLDDRRFEIATVRPFPRMITMLGRDTFFFVMPERMASTPPLQQISEFVGSGPYRFLGEEWQSGVRAVYARFDKYVPRAEPADFLAGGKRAEFDRVEWIVMPDPSTAAAALQRGEVDWVQRPLPDLLPVLREANGVKVVSDDPFGSLLILLFNHLQPPFDNRKLLQALLPAIDQSSFVKAAVGDDPAVGRAGVGFFTPGLGMDSSAGMEAVTGPRDIGLARKLVRESGYAGEKVVLLSPSNVPEQQALCEVAREVFTTVGLNVDYVSLDQGTLEKRRLSREPVGKGGWSVVPITFDGLSAADPASHQPLRGNGVNGFFGWPTSPELEALRDEWFFAPTEAAQKRICQEMQRVAWQQVPFLPLGHWIAPTAMRDNLRSVVPAPFPIFWNVRREDSKGRR
jgi:peptide/nickel transport system substrate-binding protein